MNISVAVGITKHFIVFRTNTVRNTKLKMREKRMRGLTSFFVSCTIQQMLWTTSPCFNVEQKAPCVQRLLCEPSLFVVRFTILPFSRRYSWSNPCTDSIHLRMRLNKRWLKNHLRKCEKMQFIIIIFFIRSFSMRCNAMQKALFFFLNFLLFSKTWLSFWFHWFLDDFFSSSNSLLHAPSLGTVAI